MIPDSVSIVTGSGGNGCGRAIAQRFAKDGAAVVVSDINEQGGNETVQLIQAADGNSVFFRADVREERQVHDLIVFAEHTYGRVTTLVNNGSGPFRPNEGPEFWVDTVQTERRSQNHSEHPPVRRPQHRNPGELEERQRRLRKPHRMASCLRLEESLEVRQDSPEAAARHP